ncbi:hypothetical protein GCM10007971_35960 [Oceanobacillus indicireducens]|uniref:Uncharacterized protein n=1 Tax=Oceanobacillus indicireducens TaxID=1004261 RepID=A0A917Y4Q7_9BACI|nr:hypothetical protein GCM10007971_35960 [Oceanobacillus indicireducens]
MIRGGTALLTGGEIGGYKRCFGQHTSCGTPFSEKKLDTITLTEKRKHIFYLIYYSNKSYAIIGVTTT